MLTLQEVFDKAATHLLKQGVRSYKNGVTCLYRGPNGTMCAVGALIDDAHYVPSLERKPADNLYVMEALRLSGVPADAAAELLIELQRLHDKLEPAAWNAELRYIAAEHGLDDSVVKRAL
jgi:hypothetical protein